MTLFGQAKLNVKMDKLIFGLAAFTSCGPDTLSIYFFLYPSWSFTQTLPLQPSLDITLRAALGLKYKFLFPQKPSHKSNIPYTDWWAGEKSKPKIKDLFDDALADEYPLW